MNQQPGRFDRRTLTMATAALAPFAAMPFSSAGTPGSTAAQSAFQATPPAQSDSLSLDVPMVFVNGSGSVSAPPDIAMVVVGVEVESLTLAEAQAEATTRANAILAALQAAGIADADIQTATYTVRVLRERARGEGDAAPADGAAQRRAITGYQVSNDLRLTVRDLSALGQILDDALAAGANEVRGLAFAPVDPTAVAGQARAAAMADARAKADQLAAAAGMTIGGVRSISETFAPGPVYASANAGDADTPVSIAIGTEEVVVEVHVVYALA